jgi:hypothetical protein
VKNLIALRLPMEDIESLGVVRQGIKRCVGEELRTLMKSQEVSRWKFQRLTFVTWVLISKRMAS